MLNKIKFVFFQNDGVACILLYHKVIYIYTFEKLREKPSSDSKNLLIHLLSICVADKSLSPATYIYLVILFPSLTIDHTMALGVSLKSSPRALARHVICATIEIDTARVRQSARKRVIEKKHAIRSIRAYYI